MRKPSQVGTLASLSSAVVLTCDCRIAGSFQARDNIAVFIQWARSLGLDQSVLFESSDLVLGKNEKHVLYWFVLHR